MVYHVSCGPQSIGYSSVQERFWGLLGPPGPFWGPPPALCIPLRIPQGGPPVLSVPLGSIFTTKSYKFNEAYSGLRIHVCNCGHFANDSEGGFTKKTWFSRAPGLGGPPVLSVPLGRIFTTKSLKFHEAYSRFPLEVCNSRHSAVDFWRRLQQKTRFSGSNNKRPRVAGHRFSK